MKSLYLPEFSPTAEADWRTKIAADLARRGEKATLSWEPEPHLLLDAVATDTTLTRARQQWPDADVPTLAPPCTSVQAVPLRSDGNDVKRVRAALYRSDLVLIEYRATGLDAVLRFVRDNDLPLDRIVVDGAATENLPGDGQSIADLEVLSPDRLSRLWFLGEEGERAVDPGDVFDVAVTIDTRSLRSAVDAVAIECGAVAASVDAHARRSPEVPINVLSPIGSKIFLEIAKLTALRGLLRTRNEIDGKSASVVGGEASGVRIWAFAGKVGSSTDRREHQIRLTYAAIAGILGGANCLVTMPHSADPEDVALAANVPLILRHESDLERAADTLADSYYLGTAAAMIGASASSLRDRLTAAGGLDTTEGKRILTETIARYKSSVRS